MPRQGRQPKQLTSASTQRKQRPAQPAQQPKKGGKGKSATSRHSNDDDDEPSALDVYAYKARVKRPRGDVDPLAKASAKSGKQQQQSKGKGKGRAPAQDDDEELEDDDDEDEDLSDEEGGFRIHGDEAIEWTGRKPAGFKLGMDSDEEGGKFVGFDEDIDSDLASGSEEDLPRASGSGKGNKGKKGVESTAIDLDEDEIDWDDEDGAGYMDLTELLDAGGYPSGSEDDESGSGSGDDDDEQDEDEDMSDDESEITSDDEGALEKLDSFVEGLDSKKRKAGDDGDDAGGKKKKRVVLKERTEALPEGEFAAVNADEGKVNLDDLLSSFSDSKNPRLASLRKSLKPLTGSSSSSSTDKVTTSNSHLKSSGPLAAPLPGRLQDKIDREAAYEKTKEETDKWNETVRRMKGESGLGVEGARHERLTLPLMGQAGDVRRDPNAAEWNAKFQATNELEASIQNLLAAGQMSQSDLQKREQQELAKLDPAELAARQAELRRQRDLMYRAERKAKRVAKIKSKAYRRIHRKSKEKNGESGPQLSLEDLAELDAIDGGNRVEEERTRLELLRAKERATLKHSSKGGRWARKIDGLEGLEEERNASIRDMVARREELRRKIAGVGSDEEVDEFASSGSDDGMGGSDDEDGGDFDSVRRKAFDELASLDAKEAAAKANDPKLKGVMNMKFMRDAMARADREVQKEADELRDRLARMDEMAEGGESADEEDGPGAMSEQVQGNLGRMVFGPSGAGQTAAPEANSSSAAPKSSTTTKLSSVSIASPLVAAATASTSRPTPRSRPSLRDPSASADADSSSNPWLTLADDEPSSSTGGSGAKLSRKLNKASFGKDSASAADKSANKAARARGKQADAREADREDAKVEIDVSGEAALSSAATAGGKKGKGKAKAAPVQVGGAMVARPAEGMEQGRENDEDESDGEMDEEEIEAQRGRGPAAFKQRALVKEAFANDDVVADFAEAKRKEIERDAPREEDNTLPGWGSWGGKGAKKQKNPRKFITKIAGVDADKRKDAGLNHVIISEKKDRKAAKYMLKDLPFPYTSAAQHEHKLRTPMGPEWSTSTILRDQTMPSVLIKPGVSIRPVDKKVQ